MTEQLELISHFIWSKFIETYFILDFSIDIEKQLDQ